MVEIVKFPYDACRRVHSKKPRRSKNGTPEERAAKAAAKHRPAGAVISLNERSKNSAEEDGHSYPDFLRAFRRRIEYEFAQGKNLDQIFDEFEETYLHAVKADAEWQKRKSEISHSPLNLPDPA